MAKKFAGCTQAQVGRELVWVIKYTGYRETVTMVELEKRGRWWENEEIRDVDVCACQPNPKMQKFVDEWEAINRKHGWVTLPELFDKYAE